MRNKPWMINISLNDNIIIVPVRMLLLINTTTTTATNLNFISISAATETAPVHGSSSNLSKHLSVVSLSLSSHTFNFHLKALVYYTVSPHLPVPPPGDWKRLQFRCKWWLCAAVLSVAVLFQWLDTGRLTGDCMARDRLNSQWKNVTAVKLSIRTIAIRYQVSP